MRNGNGEQWRNEWAKFMASFLYAIYRSTKGKSIQELKMLRTHNRKLSACYRPLNISFWALSRQCSMRSLLRCTIRRMNDSTTTSQTVHGSQPPDHSSNIANGANTIRRCFFYYSNSYIMANRHSFFLHLLCPKTENRFHSAFWKFVFWNRFKRYRYFREWMSHQWQWCIGFFKCHLRSTYVQSLYVYIISWSLYSAQIAVGILHFENYVRWFHSFQVEETRYSIVWIPSVNERKYVGNYSLHLTQIYDISPRNISNIFLPPASPLECATAHYSNYIVVGNGGNVTPFYRTRWRWTCIKGT